MVQLDGTYEFVSQENFLEYLRSLLPEDVAQKQAANNTPVTIKTAPDSVTASYAGKDLTFPLGKEFEHTLSLGKTVWTTATINGDTIIFKTKLTADGSVTEERELKVSDSGLISTSSNSKGVKAVRHYKRV